MNLNWQSWLNFTSNVGQSWSSSQQNCIPVLYVTGFFSAIVETDQTVSFIILMPGKKVHGTSISFLLMSFRRLSKLSWLCVFLNCAKAKKDSRDSLNLTSFLIQLALLTASAMVIWTPVRLLLGLLINCLFLQMSTSVSNSALLSEGIPPFHLQDALKNCAPQKIRNERQFSESDCIVQWNFTKDTLQPKVENGALLQWKQTIETRVKAEQQHPLMIWLQHFL